MSSSIFNRPTSAELAMQERLNSADRAAEFMRKKIRTELTSEDRQLISYSNWFALASVDSGGRTDCSFRAGRPGFVYAPDEKHVRFGELIGNGVVASLANISETGFCSLLWMDTNSVGGIGLHVNGIATVATDGPLLEELRKAVTCPGQSPQAIVEVCVESVYPHCSRHTGFLAQERLCGDT